MRQVQIAVLEMPLCAKIHRPRLHAHAHERGDAKSVIRPLWLVVIYLL